MHEFYCIMFYVNYQVGFLIGITSVSQIFKNSALSFVRLKPGPILVAIYRHKP